MVECCSGPGAPGMRRSWTDVRAVVWIVPWDSMRIRARMQVWCPAEPAGRGLGGVGRRRQGGMRLIGGMGGGDFDRYFTVSLFSLDTGWILGTCHSHLSRGSGSAWWRWTCGLSCRWRGPVGSWAAGGHPQALRWGAADGVIVVGGISRRLRSQERQFPSIEPQNPHQVAHGHTTTTLAVAAGALLFSLADYLYPSCDLLCTGAVPIVWCVRA